MRTHLPIGLLVASSLISSCETIIRDEVEKLNPDRFTCLKVPSGIYLPGTLLRTGQAVGADPTLENLTIAYPPTNLSEFSKPYASIDRTIERGLSVSAAADLFKQLGVDAVAGANVDARYDMTIVAKENLHAGAYDDALLDTTARLNANNRVIPGADYFFIKEALLSDEVTYTFTPNVGASVAARIDAATAESTLGIAIDKGVLQIGGDEKKRLVTCIYMEVVPTSSGDDGRTRLVATTRREASAFEYERVDDNAVSVDDE